MGTRELFPTDRALVVRMIGTAVLTPLAVAAAFVALVLLAPLKIVLVVVGAMLLGLLENLRERRKRPAAAELAVADAPEVHATVERLCLAADIPKPVIVLERERIPNSWVVSLGRGRTRLHLTQGLLDRLSPSELEGVIAHELAHVAQRDAVVMTVVGGPSAALVAGGSHVGSGGGWWPLMAGCLVALVIGWLGSLGTRLLSRYRELSADAGAAALTGNPAALASALMAVSDGLRTIPKADLREAAARDAFHLLPVGAGKGWHRTLPGTHPSLRTRLARLERMEARLQAARPAFRADGD